VLYKFCGGVNDAFLLYLPLKETVVGLINDDDHDNQKRATLTNNLIAFFIFSFHFRLLNGLTKRKPTHGDKIK